MKNTKLTNGEESTVKMSPFDYWKFKNTKSKKEVDELDAKLIDLQYNVDPRAGKMFVYQKADKWGVIERTWHGLWSSIKINDGDKRYTGDLTFVMAKAPCVFETLDEVKVAYPDVLEMRKFNLRALSNFMP